MGSESSTRVSAPGSIMMLGEHAVVYGRRALVAAVDRRIRVTAKRRTDRRVRIQSALGEYETELGRLEPVAPFTFALAALSAHPGELHQGFELSIESNFPSTVGLGSSAAVTVAVIHALDVLSGAETGSSSLHERSLDAVRRVQGAGSGADLAATVHGGVIAYRESPREWSRVNHLPPITLLYSGSKTPTPEVIRHVASRRERDLVTHDAIFDAMDASIEPAIAALNQADWRALGSILDENQERMRRLGVSNETLEDLVAQLRRDDCIFGAKISGAGLGDCVVGIGIAEGYDGPHERIPVVLSTEGVRID